MVLHTSTSARNRSGATHLTFLVCCRYGFSSVGFNFLISALVIQTSMLTNHWWHCIFDGHWKDLELEITTLITADFAAGAAMISFGAMLGKTSPLELVFIAMSQMMFYGLNENIGVIKLKAVDMGGSIFVHTFGAYFGLACSYMITPKEKFEEKDEGSTHTSDMFAMVGTIFLWMFWPSFNGALATESQQHRVIINTVLALTASCLITFAMSAIMRHDKKFDMVDIQNATLAGGVAVGSASDLVIGPWGAILLGCIGGTVSVFGYTRVQPWLQANCGLHDTCGVHNLHGMPGIIGGIGGAISAAVVSDNEYGQPITSIYAARDTRSAMQQAGFQMAALTCTLAIAIGGGLLVGTIVNFMRSSIDGGPKNYFHDADYWEGVPELEGANSYMGVDGEEKKYDVGAAAAEGSNDISPEPISPEPIEIATGKDNEGRDCF